mmetsp:Transcript_1741/g.3564  ORF Transcript_1741/g.3564 Transcript_1741/m.3564 type:complete len:347 (-) Transcript_1741:335-1375(-)|eukprot:CAMPEP_0182578378 /NCGR_PEP_ID=MMETSP1324-20130603/40874_1 /TAXON_ID=236786 /ORGANISM="Florenciella sp., Strain RCC1587" /LENGTH=346 /DNA_ID=CAMNT_0024794323 /DNA_START=32 /DNA_END=1072 /DNA_ORIENTATION=-
MARFSALILALSLASASAFAPSTSARALGLQLNTRSNARVTGTPVRSTPLAPTKGTTMLALPLANVVDPAVLNKAATITRWVLAGPVLYALMSVNEYFTHRYYQHTGFNKSEFLQSVARFFLRLKKGEPVPRVGGGGHVEHHAETLDDMSLKLHDDSIGGRWRTTAAAKMLDSDPYRGTAFTWLVTGIMTVQMLPTTLPVFHLMGFSLARTFQILIPGMIIHALIWNALHPHMHGLPDVPISVGVPSWPMAGLRKTPYFKWLYMNHEGHHVVGGQGNYNVACPLTDHLCGTYVPQSEWRPRQAATLATLAARKAPDVKVGSPQELAASFDTPVQSAEGAALKPNLA